MFVVGVTVAMGAPSPGPPRGSPERPTNPQWNAKHVGSVDFTKKKHIKTNILEMCIPLEHQAHTYQTGTPTER